MVNNSGESGQPCLVPDVSGNGFSFSPFVFISLLLLFLPPRMQGGLMERTLVTQGE